MIPGCLGMIRLDPKRFGQSGANVAVALVVAAQARTANAVPRSGPRFGDRDRLAPIEIEELQRFHCLEMGAAAKAVKPSLPVHIARWSSQVRSRPAEATIALRAMTHAEVRSTVMTPY